MGPGHHEHSYSAVVSALRFRPDVLGLIACAPLSAKRHSVIGRLRFWPLQSASCRRPAVVAQTRVTAP